MQIKGVFDWHVKTYHVLKTEDFAEMEINFPIKHKIFTTAGFIFTIAIRYKSKCLSKDRKAFFFLEQKALQAFLSTKRTVQRAS